MQGMGKNNGHSMDEKQTARELEDLIKEEISVYTRYLTVLDEERRDLVASRAERLLMHSAERSHLVNLMRAAQDERRKIMRRYSADRLLTLSAFIQTYLPEKEGARLMPLVAQLKNLVRSAQSDTGEFSQVASFAMRMMSGLVSILWSATQNIVRSYSPQGRMKEVYHPSVGRAAAVLKCA